MKNKGLGDFLNQEKKEAKDFNSNRPEVNKKDINTTSKVEKKKVINKPSTVKTDSLNDLTLNDFSFNSLIKDIDLYKEEFNLSSHFNVRLSEDNYQALKKLKATDIKMVHLVNLAITKIVKSKDYNKYIKG